MGNIHALSIRQSTQFTAHTIPGKLSADVAIIREMGLNSELIGMLFHCLPGHWTPLSSLMPTVGYYLQNRKKSYIHKHGPSVFFVIHNVFLNPGFHFNSNQGGRMMSTDEMKKMILDLLGKIAPEADIDHLNPDDRFRNQCDFTSVDFMDFALGLQDKLQIKIPEEDYPQLATLSSCIAYLQSHSSKGE
jgi:acyl carrier protein